MKQYLDDHLKSLNKSASETEFYKLVATTCAKVNDEHLIPMPSKDNYLSLKNTHHYFPFSLKIIDRRFYVLKTAASNSIIPVGTPGITAGAHKPLRRALNKTEIFFRRLTLTKTTW